MFLPVIGARVLPTVRFPHVDQNRGHILAQAELIGRYKR